MYAPTMPPEPLEPHAAQDDYVISLETFEGPLDLLLFLIRRAEVDVQDIPIAAITDQYLLILRQVDEVDIEQAGEFLVMAATLIELKSRTLAPIEENEEQDTSNASGDLNDPKQDLIRQLLAYQRIRTAGEALDVRRASEALRIRVRVRPSDEALKLDDCMELDDVHLMDLLESWESVAAAIDFNRLGAHHISIDDAPIALYQTDLVDRLTRRSGKPLVLQEAFAGKTASQRIGLFLAVLELVKGRRIICHQDTWGEPIQLEFNPDWDQAMLEDQDPEVMSSSDEGDASVSDVPSPISCEVAPLPTESAPATGQDADPSN